VSISRIKNVRSFRSFVIALPFFRSDRISAQGNLVTLDYFSAIEQLQRALFLKDNDAIRMLGSHLLSHTDRT